jgi:hypothetical protein
MRQAGQHDGDNGNDRIHDEQAGQQCAADALAARDVFAENGPGAGRLRFEGP